MERTVVARGAAILAVAAILFTAACSSDADPIATPTPVEFDEGEWVIEVPEGWTRRDATAEVDGEKAIRYEGPDGEFFVVAIDPLGSDYAYDTLWNYTVSGDGFAISDQTDCTSDTDEYCTDDDERFDGVVFWETGSEPEEVGGHVWYFLFGDEDSKTVDTAVFEGILGSIQVTA